MSFKRLSPGQMREEWLRQTMAIEFDRKPHAEPMFLAAIDARFSDHEGHPLEAWKDVSRLVIEVEAALGIMPHWKDSLKMLNALPQKSSVTPKQLFRWEYNRAVRQRKYEEQDDSQTSTAQEIEADMQTAIANMDQDMLNLLPKTFLSRFKKDQQIQNGISS